MPVASATSYERAAPETTATTGGIAVLSRVMQQNWCLRAGIAMAPVIVAVVLVAGRAPTQNTPPPAAPPGLEKIQHFVFIMQENRSFDHYFGTYLGAEGIPAGICVPNHDTALVNQGGAHNWADALRCLDNGMMDGFIGGSVVKPGDVMGWHDYHELPN